MHEDINPFNMRFKPRVLRIINRFNLGGPTLNVAYLSRHLFHFETLLAGGEKDDSEDSSEFILEKLGLEPVKIKSMRRSINPFNDLLAFIEIVKLIKKFNPHIIHTHASKAGTLGRLAAIYCKVPIIIHTFHGHVFHSYFPAWKTFIFKTIERYLASKSTKIIAISERQKVELSEIHKICDASKISVIPLGFDLEKFRDLDGSKRKSFRNKYFLEEDEIAVGIIGRLVPIKNHKLFLGAVAHLSHLKGFEKVKFFLVGDGEIRTQLFTSAKELGLNPIFFPEEPKAGRLIFTSWIKEVDMVMAGLDLVLLTSFNEGTPVSLIEAQAAGKAVVSTNVGGIENIVSNQTAILIENNNQNALNSTLEKLLQNPQKIKEMGSYGWDLVGKKFNYTRLVNDMDQLYKELLTIKKNPN
jgi:glycosyltransferase involved in cell wall biosynthesis